MILEYIRWYSIIFRQLKEMLKAIANPPASCWGVIRSINTPRAQVDIQSVSISTSRKAPGRLWRFAPEPSLCTAFALFFLTFCTSMVSELCPEAQVALDGIKIGTKWAEHRSNSFFFRTFGSICLTFCTYIAFISKYVLDSWAYVWLFQSQHPTWRLCSAWVGRCEVVKAILLFFGCLSWWNGVWMALKHGHRFSKRLWGCLKSLSKMGVFGCNIWHLIYIYIYSKYLQMSLKINFKICSICASDWNAAG